MSIDNPPSVQRVERLVVSSDVPVLDTGMFDHMTRIAKLMAASSLVPAHLNSVRKVGTHEVDVSEGEAVANCFLVVNQATRWRMDPFAVAQHVFVTNGRIGYEGKLIAAVINTHPLIEHRLIYEYEGSGEGRKVKVTAKLKGDDTPRSIEGTVKDWKTSRNGSPWSNANQYDQMLSYRGAREWARRWMPEAILGVYGDDELEQFTTATSAAASADHQPQDRSGASALRRAVENASDAVIVAGAGAGAPGAAPEGGKPAEPAQPVPANPPQELPAGEPKAEAKPEAKPAAAEPAEKKDPPPQEAGRPSAPPPKVGDAGTAELKARFIKSLERCQDLDVLNIKRDEVNFHTWTAADLADIDIAYKARRDALLAA